MTDWDDSDRVPEIFPIEPADEDQALVAHGWTLVLDIRSLDPVEVVRRPETTPLSNGQIKQFFDGSPQLVAYPDGLDVFLDRLGLSGEGVLAIRIGGSKDFRDRDGISAGDAIARDQLRGFAKVRNGIARVAVKNDRSGAEYKYNLGLKPAAGAGGYSSTVDPKIRNMR